MGRQMDMISLRINSEIHDLIIKISHETQMSKQEIIRQMILAQLSRKFGEDIMLNMQNVKQKIKQEYEVPTHDQKLD